MNEAFEFHTIIAESYIATDDTERYWFLRNGELDDKIFNEWDAELFAPGVAQEYRQKFTVLDGFDQPCNCHRHDKHLH